MHTIERQDFQSLLDVIIERGYEIIGPVIRDHAIVFDNITSVDEFPVGWTDSQDGGMYRLENAESDRLFDYVVGPQSPKKYFYPPTRRLWSAKRHGQKYDIVPHEEEPPKLALFGVRSCELHAIAEQDKILIEGPYADPVYRLRRQNAVIVTVNCTRPGGTCFCASMDTGPKAKIGFDVALTEIKTGDRHYFVAEAGTAFGHEILKQVADHETDEAELQAADRAVEKAEEHMGRSLDTTDLPAMLNRRFDDPHWDTIASRCLTCSNCTMVCPTCFCANVEDTTSLSGDTAERVRRWDSCFTVGFSYIHGGSIRATETSRYRQWMMHKLSHWVEQFGTFGCVGCGRCITWCPVGIDITEEARTFRETDKLTSVIS